MMESGKEGTFGGVLYECVRCGTPVSAEELAQLPEIKCICGYRILKKDNVLLHRLERLNKRCCTIGTVIIHYDNLRGFP